MFGIPRLYAMIGAGVIVALFLAWVWRLDTLRARHLKEAQTAELKLAISNQSLASCNGHIADNNKRIAEASARFAQDRTQAARDLARAEARYEAQRATVGALEASAKRTDLPACKVSTEALSVLEGL